MVMNTFLPKLRTTMMTFLVDVVPTHPDSAKGTVIMMIMLRRSRQWEVMKTNQRNRPLRNRPHHKRRLKALYLVDLYGSGKLLPDILDLSMGIKPQLKFRKKKRLTGKRELVTPSVGHAEVHTLANRTRLPYRLRFRLQIRLVDPLNR
jgi:hypothetical protein